MTVKNHLLVARFPSGEEITNPEFDTIRWLMRRPYDTHWLYSPTAILSWQRSYSEVDGAWPDGRPMIVERVDTKFQLTLIKHKRIGWFCLHCRNTDAKNRWSVPFPPTGDRKSWIEHWSCGDTKFFLRDCFIRHNECEDVVKAFMQNGGRSKTVAWKSLSQITPHSEQPPENATRVVTIPG